MVRRSAVSFPPLPRLTLCSVLVSAPPDSGKVPVSGYRRKLLLSLSTAAVLAALTFSTAGPALAAPAHSVKSTEMSARSAKATTVLPARLRAFYWARTQYGKPYIWGGTGPGGYDCSGLVMMAYRHAGINLPRTTYQMLSSWHLVRVSRPQKGDLAFYGSGHVELYARGNLTFGAHSAGQIIGWIAFGPWWHPTAYYRVR
jgi:cell wall-associated NlpC family hydrolase